MPKESLPSLSKAALGIRCVYPGCTYEGLSGNFKKHAIAKHLDKSPDRYTVEFRHQYERRRGDTNESELIRELVQEMQSLRAEIREARAKLEELVRRTSNSDARLNEISGTKTTLLDDRLDHSEADEWDAETAADGEDVPPKPTVAAQRWLAALAWLRRWLWGE